MPSRYIVPAEMSFSLSMPAVSLSMPSIFIVVAEMNWSLFHEEILPAEMSLSMPEEELSMPLELSDMCLSIINSELLMSAKFSEMSMSMVLVPTINQNDISISTENSDLITADPVVVPTIEQNDINISINSDNPDVSTAYPDANPNDSMNTPITVFGGNLANGDDNNNGGDAESLNSSRAYSTSTSQICTFLVVSLSMTMIGGYR